MAESKYTRVPNLVDDLGLLPATFRLYVHIKRVAGDKGKCWEGQDRLAEICRLNTKTVIRAKRELQDAGLISITKQSYKGHVRDIITIVDIWSKNQKAISGEERVSPKSKSATDNIGVIKVPRSKSATAIGVKEVPGEGENSHCINNQGRITNEEDPSFPAEAGPTLSKDHFIARMQKELGFPEERRTDPIPDRAKEAKFIKKMLASGFTEDQIFETWHAAVAKRGCFVSMRHVNDTIRVPKFPGYDREYTEPPEDDDQDEKTSQLGFAKQYHEPPE